MHHKVILFIIFWRIIKLPYTVTIPFYIPTNSAQKFQFLYILIKTIILMDARWYLMVVLIFISLIISGFRKSRGNKDQIAIIHWIIEKAREFRKNIYFLFIGYSKAIDRVDHNKLWKILKEMRKQDHFICLYLISYRWEVCMQVTK